MLRSALTRLTLALSLMLVPLAAAQAQSVCLTDEADLIRRVHVSAQFCRADWQVKLGAEAYQSLEDRRQRLNNRLLAQAQTYHPDRPRAELAAEINCITSDCKGLHAPPRSCLSGSAQGDFDILARWAEDEGRLQSEPVLLVDPEITRPAPLPLSSAGLQSPIGRLMDAEGLKRALRQIDIDTLNPACTDPDIRARSQQENSDLVATYGGQPVPFDLPDSTGVEDWILTCKPNDQDVRYLRAAWQISECTGSQVGFDPYFYQSGPRPLWAHDLPWASEEVVIPYANSVLTWQMYFGLFNIYARTARFEPAPDVAPMATHRIDPSDAAP